MVILELFGCLGGCIILVKNIWYLCKWVYQHVERYQMYKEAYEDRDKKEEIVTMGFKTKKEHEEIESKLRARKGA